MPTTRATKDPAAAISVAGLAATVLLVRVALGMTGAPAVMDPAVPADKIADRAATSVPVRVDLAVLLEVLREVASNGIPPSKGVALGLVVISVGTIDAKQLQSL